MQSATAVQARPHRADRHAQPRRPGRVAPAAEAAAALAAGILGRPAHELARDAAGLAKLGCPATEIGVIIGTKPFHPINSSAWINWLHRAAEPGDGTVECDSAELAQASDSIAINAGHTFLPSDPRVIAAVLRFVKQGRF